MPSFSSQPGDQAKLGCDAINVIAAVVSHSTKIATTAAAAALVAKAGVRHAYVVRDMVVVDHLQIFTHHDKFLGRRDRTETFCRCRFLRLRRTFLTGVNSSSIIEQVCVEIKDETLAAFAVHQL